LGSGNNRPGDSIGDVIMQTCGMIYGISATSSGATFQRAELGDEPWMI